MVLASPQAGNILGLSPCKPSTDDRLLVAILTVTAGSASCIQTSHIYLVVRHHNGLPNRVYFIFQSPASSH